MQKVIEHAFGQRQDTSNVRYLQGPAQVRVFKQRLAYYANFYGIVFSGYGSKTLSEQAVLYMKWVNKVLGANRAAKPGESRHNFDIAFDNNSVAGHQPATMDADYLLSPEKQTLAKFGLCLPFWKGSTVSNEPWHIQPIETWLYKGEWHDFLGFDDLVDTLSGHRMLLRYVAPTGWAGAFPSMRGADVAFVQARLGLVVDGSFGPASAAGVAAWRVKNGLPNAGIVDDAMWNLLLKPTPVTDYKVLYESLKVAWDATSSEVTMLRTENVKLKSDLVTTGMITQSTGVALDAANLRIAKAKEALA
jgi:peptidoglycan hydrolase-like protein with peptidoglycan-binding domain